MNQKRFHIYCDGGFGNRFNILVAGLAIADAGSFEPVVIWPENNWCRAAFDDLFDITLETLDENLVYFSDKLDQFCCVMHEDQLNFKIPFVHPNSFDSLNSLISYFETSDSNSLFYYNNLIPSYIDTDALIESVNRLAFKKDIMKMAENLFQEQAVSKISYYGLHLRNTDFGVQKPDYLKLLDIVKADTGHKYFVCSDDKETENLFNQLSNVFTFKKDNYVEKLDEQGDWNSYIEDDSGRVFPFNVNRGAESVKEALVDLLLLSHSQIVRTSNSTFLDTAILLQKTFHKYDSFISP